MKHLSPILGEVRISTKYKYGLPEKVGEIIESPTSHEHFFLTERKHNLHFMRIKQGYPISSRILLDLKSMGINKIRISEMLQNGEVHIYEALVSEYLKEDSFQYEGYDAQKCLPLAKTRKIK